MNLANQLPKNVACWFMIAQKEISENTLHEDKKKGTRTVTGDLDSPRFFIAVFLGWSRF